jgi:hypothetical protein
MKKIDLIGKRFGRWTVIKESENKGKNVAWVCLCDCGNKRTCLSYNLLSGKSTNCGCVRRKKLSVIFKKHGGTGTRLYSIYKSMKQRCYNKNNSAYKYYGGKGIVICKNWKNDFSVFRDWALQNKYKENISSIDRINPNGNYCPENCRWVSLKKQQNNKLNSMFVIIDNKKLTIAEWAEKTKTNKQTLYDKFYRLINQLGLENKNVSRFEIKCKK